MARKLAYQALKLVGKNWGKSSLTIEKNRGDIRRLADRIEKRFGLEDIHNLKPRHLITIFEEMKAEGRVATTLCSYATAARTIAQAIGKQNILPRTNQELGFSRAGERFRPIHADIQGLEEVRRRLYARSEWQGLQTICACSSDYGQRKVCFRLRPSRVTERNISRSGAPKAAAPGEFRLRMMPRKSSLDASGNSSKTRVRHP